MAARLTAARRTATRSEDLARVAIRAVGRLVVTVLVAFHAWLLWTHLFAGRVLEPQTAVRWMAAALVLVGFRALNRMGMPLFFGRRAIILWLLVVLLHCHAVWTGDTVSMDLAVPETVTALAQLTVPLSTLLGVLFLALLAAQTARAVRFPASADAPALFAGLPVSGRVLRFAPRPPPLA